MPGNENSGRRPRRQEERKLIGQHFSAAVSVVVEILKDKKAPKTVRLDAARLLIQQHIGKPNQTIDADILELRAVNLTLLHAYQRIQKMDLATQQELQQRLQQVLATPGD